MVAGGDAREKAAGAAKDDVVEVDQLFLITIQRSVNGNLRGRQMDGRVGSSIDFVAIRLLLRPILLRLYDAGACGGIQDGGYQTSKPRAAAFDPGRRL